MLVRLCLPMSTKPAVSDDVVLRLLDGELRPLIQGRIRLSQHERMLYATDASIYQMTPLAVVHPADLGEIPIIARFCFERGIPMLPRGGGTSLPGQCVNRAVVIDYSPTCRRLLEVHQQERWCLVEPGITIDELNRQLLPTGLFFAPDPATAAQCAIGGCIGNNAAGARSIRYGRTSENVMELEVVLADGRSAKLGAGAGGRDAVALELARGVMPIVLRNAEQIRQRFPRTARRNAGYALDMILKQMDGGKSAEDIDMTPLLCGSEGTLAITIRAKLKLHPITRAKGLAIISFLTLEDAITAVPACVATDCTAVELIDDVVLEAARGNTECRRYMDLLADVGGGVPAAVLYVEYQEGTPAEVQAGFARLQAALPGAIMHCHTDTGALLRAWALRKAGEPLLHGLAGHRKPVTCVEDNAVPIENLYRFIEGFKEIVTRHGTRAAYYAHASVGVLHVRPMLDLHDRADRDRLRSIAQEVALWAQRCGGVMSGEHGDGRIRGPLLRQFYGDAIMSAFAEVKRVFDPSALLNPGNITQPGPVESITQNLRILPKDSPLAFVPVVTFFQYGDQEGFGGALEMCNGAGVCRKTAGGAMCPSYRATLDERHSTRGRGNALRLAVSRQGAKKAESRKQKVESRNGEAAWNDRETLATLHLCLSCKACKSECPSNVDISRLKAEYLAQSYKAAGRTPLSAKAFGHVRMLNRLGAAMPAIANYVVNLRVVRWAMEKVLKIDPRRSMPIYEKSLFKQLKNQKSKIKNQKLIVLFPDCFMTYNEPRIGLAAARVLGKLGYDVILPKTGCCGRSLISTGLLGAAIKSADRVIADLRPYIEDPNVAVILVAEPSCLSAFKDDYLQLKCSSSLELRRQLAAKSMLIEDFIDQKWEEHPQRPRLAAAGGAPVLLHAHCHQKAMWTADTSARMLKRLCGARLQVLDTGCCGMAGSFGFTADRYDLSMKIGELSLLPLVRQAAADAIIVAPGTSCRHQIHDGSGRRAIHPIELVDQLLT